MPFTPAHIAATLPVAEPLRRHAPHALSALVIGSMAPDIPYYLPIPYDGAASHALANAWGWTALLALATWAVWTFVVAPPVRDLAPRWIRARLGPAPRRVRLLDVLLAYAAAVAGILTHLLWDSFTHSEGWFVRHHPTMSVVHGRWPLYQDLQLASSALGCLLVAAYVVVFLVNHGPRPIAAPFAAWGPAACGGLVVAVLLGAAVGAGLSPSKDSTSELAVYVATRSITAGVGAAALVAAAWWWQRLRGGRPQALTAEPASQASTSAR